MNDRLLCISAVADLLGVCNRQVRRLVIEGRIPAPAYLGRHPRWPASEISEWMSLRCPDAETFAATKKGGAA